MDRTPPVVNSDEIELYIRTYYSLLRSTGPIRIRSLEETHMTMKSNLHYLADSPELDVSALVYSALRMPECIVDTHLVVLGQMDDVFVREGYAVNTWKPVKARARRRKYFFEARTATMAAFVASVSDIDDLIPSMTTFQIEWNKLHQKLNNGSLHDRLINHKDSDPTHSGELLAIVSDVLGLSPGDLSKLSQLWPGNHLITNLQKAARNRMDLRVILLGSGLADYRRSVQLWWARLESAVPGINMWERPIYFVSSNTHSIVNLITGLAAELRDDVLEYVERDNPEDLLSEYQSLPPNDNGHHHNFLYYASRLHITGAKNRSDLQRMVAEREKEVGVTRVSDPHVLDVEAQVIELNKLDRNRIDPRLQLLSDEEWDLLKNSNAVLLNVDYPLGMAAYHVFSQISTAVGRIVGVYLMGKAATLNGRVGDVMIPNVIYDEHSRNTFLFRNSFTAQDVGGLLNYGTVFDNQKAVTVRGTILQNRDFMHVFYEEGYTDIEMELGPYLSGVYEDVYPQRYPVNEIVNLFINVPYDIGVLHYASDTPISRRQTLLSKSLSYFGVDATYATSIAVMRRILSQEVARMGKAATGAGPLARAART
ncbi:MAG: hypothetical protein IPK16_00610 [Anaerolineales bacterium]|nr:hypothetical protein [Anaerolineales bacterium]